MGIKSEALEAAYKEGRWRQQRCRIRNWVKTWREKPSEPASNTRSSQRRKSFVAAAQERGALNLYQYANFQKALG